MTFPKGNQPALRAFYGNPDTNFDGMPETKWEAENLVSIIPPYRMVLAWDKKRTLHTIRTHKKCAASLLRILTRIKNHYGTQEAIEAARMHLYGGCYNFRLKRGISELSVHAYGAAIDLDPANNGLGKKYGRGMMPLVVVNIFKEEGWKWGGLFHRPDCMHFEATN
jgi:hypothetical protein